MTLCDLLTIFVETKSVTKSRVHCIFEILFDFYALTQQERIKMIFKLDSSLASTLKSFNPNENREVAYNDHFEVTIPV